MAGNFIYLFILEMSQNILLRPPSMHYSEELPVSIQRTIWLACCMAVVDLVTYLEDLF